MGAQVHIAILGSRGIPANYGGFETFAEHLSVGLAECGVDVTVYCPAYQDYREPTYKGVKLRFISSFDRNPKSRLIRAVGALVYDIVSLIDAGLSKADVIYMLGYASGPFLVVPRLLGKPMVVNPDGLEWKSKRWGLFARSWLHLCEWTAARGTNGLIADAEPIQEHFVAKYNVPAACIPYGFTPPSLANAVQDDDAPYIAVARMVPETSIPLMVRGHRQSGSKRRLLIIGPVADQRFFDSEVMPLVDGEQVQYLGAIYDRDRLIEIRATAYCLLHGHASDGTNPSLLESMGCGSPVIAVRTRSNAAVLGPNEDFYFSDEASLAAAINRFEALSADERGALGRSNRQRIEQDFSWGSCVAKHLDAIERFTGRAPVAPSIDQRSKAA